MRKLLDSLVRDPQ